MRVVVVVAALLLAGVAEAQVVRSAPTCKANQSGAELVTRIVFPDGYTVEGPWRVTGVVKSGRNTTLTAVLDHIIETAAISSRREHVALPGPIQMKFTGRSMNELLNEAANLWCVTVLKARPTSPPASVEAGPISQNRIM